ncbi:hypothetical protein [Streptomyces sp. NPDC021096]|uniref:hypothetical protein n=1 Tax=Streptomyces sp. NPDC021096 TaxID=3154792 RepID=UPI0033DC0797
MYTYRRAARARAPRAKAVTATLALVLAAATLSTGCGTDNGSGPAKSSESSKSGRPGELPKPVELILDTPRLERALPDQFSVPADVAQPRNRKAWDSYDLTICQSEEWQAKWCAQALSFGIAAFTNMQDQELSVRLISFTTPEKAAGLFAGEGTEDEVGKNPPGDQIDGFEISPGQGWEGRGINVRQGSVIASIKYTWKQGTAIPSDRLMSVTRMTVERIQQALRGEAPVASVRP